MLEITNFFFEKETQRKLLWYFVERIIGFHITITKSIVGTKMSFSLPATILHILIISDILYHIREV